MNDIETRRYTLEIQEDSDGQFIVLPEDEMERLDWKEGDVIEWIDNENGTWTIRKKV